jgi:hypothetical protein
VQVHGSSFLQHCTESHGRGTWTCSQPVKPCEYQQVSSGLEGNSGLWRRFNSPQPMGPHNPSACTLR